MKPNQFWGLIKFFRNEEFLDSLISGCFHCTPPEVYRLDEQAGVSDKFESCAYSYRVERNDSPIVVKIGEKEFSDGMGLTIHNGVNKDSWMHCWFTLRLPIDQNALNKLKSDIAKMKEEFGEHYAFIPAPNLSPLIERLKSSSDKSLSCSEVEYSGDRNKWGNLCKSIDYSYQREYRFLFGECSTSEQDFYIFYSPDGFKDLIFKNADVKLRDKNSDTVWFELGA